MSDPFPDEVDEALWDEACRRAEAIREFLKHQPGKMTAADVALLSSGEAIVFGSAFHIPTRVQFDRPDPGPYSQTAAPFHEWSRGTTPFPLDTVIAAWGA